MNAAWGVEKAPALAGRRVLVIEDSPDNLRLFRAVLRLEGAETFEADGARVGIEIARRERPDVILMDIEMPDMDGLEATRILHTDERTRDIPIVAVTASVLDSERPRTKEAGCIGFIPKPIDPTVFGEQVAAFLRGEMPAPRAMRFNCPPPTADSETTSRRTET
jgi:CheY-like chemotaxis protein